MWLTSSTKAPCLLRLLTLVFREASVIGGYVVGVCAGPQSWVGEPFFCSGLRLPVAPASLAAAVCQLGPLYATVRVAWQLRPCSANGVGMQQEVFSLTHKRESTCLSQLISFFFFFFRPLKGQSRIRVAELTGCLWGGVAQLSPSFCANI